MNRQISRTDFIIYSLRFSVILAASIICICLKKLNVSAAIIYFAFFVLFEAVLAVCLYRKKMHIPHAVMFVLQTGIFCVLVLHDMKRPLMDIYVTLGITCFVLFFLLLIFPLLYKKS
ncbi:MAG: hypothetical protein MJ159_05290 [Treponemataceae bacterium]|nr:hypothetical protein [Treponemataceae bacterium]